MSMMKWKVKYFEFGRPNSKYLLSKRAKLYKQYP